MTASASIRDTSQSGAEPSKPHLLDALLKPASIAFVGASAKVNTPGNTMLRAVTADGYSGRVYPVNPKYDLIEGMPCFASLAALPETVDHVVLGLANEYLEEGLKQAVQHGAKAVTIFASCDLTDRNDDGLAERLAQIAREAGVMICGGNGMGFCNPQIGLRVTGYASPLPMKPGGVAFITQSGSAFSALAYNDQRLKFSVCISSGRELTTTADDYMDWALDQPSTKVIGLFLETAREPEQFARALAKADRLGIPVIVLKVGRTEMSAAFAASHSGAIAGDDAAYEALFARHGVMTVETLDDLAANLLLFSAGKPAAPGGLASLHDSGGEREMVADLAMAAGVRFADVSTETLERLRPHLDSGLQPANPLDVWGSGRDFEKHVEACMDAMLADPDTAIGVLFQDIRDGSYVAEGFTRALIASSRKSEKPVTVVSNYASVNHRSLALATTESGVPVIDGTNEGLSAISNLFAFRDRRQRSRTLVDPVAAEVRDRWRLRLTNGAPLDELEGLRLLSDYGLSTARATKCSTAEAATHAAAELGYPVAVKTGMPGIQHKSDVGGVKLGLSDAQAVQAAYDDLAARLGPDVVVAEMAPKGVEIALGLVRDPQFGPYIVVASGGIWIEILRDRAVALPPLSLEEAQEITQRLRIHPLLEGSRGMPPADMAALHDAIVRFSMLAADLGDLIDEMDVNPMLVSHRGCVAVDALVVARNANSQQLKGDLK
ncbi:acetate--CoA ligase family protein [Pseudaminobacter sp. 19-2017]|uniref:Acetate--CoA ligase family protein n=1 Tax=Pseudaminobacter soli (ex Zhang et al. 2022) TaxID=2831468 RepID=A0A942E5Y7_9HYPH|nr:acetate--CoA ligase family protein [Pseudaminobacter soli]MBS3649062.1 acetate--CoA ligase family protein [Pseudaminobacter soli]